MGRLKRSTEHGDRAREYAAAERLGRRERAAGLRAKRAQFDPMGRRVILELISGYSFGIPLARLPEVSRATNAELAKIEVLGGGSVLHWESLDADYSVQALILAAIGTRSIARQLGRIGGRSTSTAKAEAARLNGAKGGRPRLSGKR